MKRAIFPYFIFCFLFSSGCIDQIQFELSDNENFDQLIVQGQIHTGAGPYTIRIGRTTSLSNGEYIPELGVTGKINSNKGLSEDLVEKGDGWYQIPGRIVQGEVNISYELELYIGNKTYLSHTESIPEIVEMDTIHWEQIDKPFLSSENIEVTRPFVTINIDTPIPNLTQGPFLRWETFETYSLVENPPPPPASFSYICYFTFPTNPQEILLFNGQNFTGAYWENQWVGDRIIDWTFSSKHIFSVVQISMTEQAFQYWDRVKRVIDQEGTIFDSPPAAVPGNIVNIDNPQELVLGYFEAVSVDTIRTFTLKSDFAPELASPLCISVGVYDPLQPPACYDCQSLEGASIVRPHFFQF